jgi:hypothetical protein
MAQNKEETAGQGSLVEHAFPDIVEVKFPEVWS